MKQLNAAERSDLRARAHSLKPVVLMGAGGLTPGVILEVERSLKAHELIKIRVGESDHDERQSICESICTQTGAAPVQHIGKVLVIYREKPKEETRVVPAGTRVKPGTKTARPVRKSRATPGSGTGHSRGKQPFGASSKAARRSRSR